MVLWLTLTSGNLRILNQFFNLYFFNKDVSLDIQFPRIKLCTVGKKILVEGSMSTNSNYGLSFYFMSKNGKLFAEF